MTTSEPALPGIRPTDQYNQRRGMPAVRTSARCNVCKSGDAILTLVNKMLVAGFSYTEVHNQVTPLARSMGKTISYDSIRNHQQAHLPIGAAAIQTIVQRRVEDTQRDFAEGTRTVVTAVEYAESMMTKAFLGLADENTEVTPMEGLAAAQAFQKMTKDSESDANVSSLLHQMDLIITAVREEVPEEYWQAIANRLSGAPGITGTRAIVEAQVVPDDDDDDVFDPVEGDLRDDDI